MRRTGRVGQRQPQPARVAATRSSAVAGPRRSSVDLVSEHDEDEQPAVGSTTVPASELDAGQRAGLGPHHAARRAPRPASNRSAREPVDAGHRQPGEHRRSSGCSAEAASRRAATSACGLSAVPRPSPLPPRAADRRARRDQPSRASRSRIAAPAPANVAGGCCRPRPAGPAPRPSVVVAVGQGVLDEIGQAGRAHRGQVGASGADGVARRRGVPVTVHAMAGQRGGERGRPPPSPGRRPGRTDDPARGAVQGWRAGVDRERGDRGDEAAGDVARAPARADRGTGEQRVVEAEARPWSSGPGEPRQQWPLARSASPAWPTTASGSPAPDAEQHVAAADQDHLAGRAVDHRVASAGRGRAGERRHRGEHLGGRRRDGAAVGRARRAAPRRRSGRSPGRPTAPPSAAESTKAAAARRSRRAADGAGRGAVEGRHRPDADGTRDRRARGERQGSPGRPGRSPGAQVADPVDGRRTAPAPSGDGRAASRQARHRT